MKRLIHGFRIDLIVILSFFNTLGQVQSPPIQFYQSFYVLQDVEPQITNQEQFIDYLRTRELTVDIVDRSRQRFLKSSGTLLCVSGASLKHDAHLQVYTYPDSRTLQIDIQQIQPDGSTIIQPVPDGGGQALGIEWVDPPHFFKHERLLILYSGDDHAMLNLLTEILGSQFAGAAADAVAYRIQPLESCQDMRAQQFHTHILSIVTIMVIIGVMLWMGIQLQRQRR